MEKIKYMFMAVLVALVSMTVTSCSDDDDDVSQQKNPSSVIVGTYAGTLRNPGDNTGAPCYVAFERLSNTTVMLTRFIRKNMVLILKMSILRFLSQMVFISLIQNRI